MNFDFQENKTLLLLMVLHPKTKIRRYNQPLLIRILQQDYIKDFKQQVGQ